MLGLCGYSGKVIVEYIHFITIWEYFSIFYVIYKIISQRLILGVTNDTAYFSIMWPYLVSVLDCDIKSIYNILVTRRAG